MKQLTGKAKEDFFEWLATTYYRDIRSISDLERAFSFQPQSAQFGLIQEWGDSVGYDIEISTGEFGGFNIVIYYKSYYSLEGVKSRPEAQQKAVEKLSEIYNQLKQ